MPLHPASMFTCWNQVPGNSPAGTVPPPHKLPAHCGSLWVLSFACGHMHQATTPGSISLPLILKGDPVATSSLQCILTGRLGAYAG